MLPLLIALIACNKNAAPPGEPPPKPPRAEDVAKVEQARFDSLIVPGKRVGPVDAKVTKESLIRDFGAAAVSDKQIDMGEGFFVPGFAVSAGDRSLSVALEPAETGHTVSVRHLGKAWRTADGLGIGSTLAEVEAAVGPFDLAGMNWDYAGTIDLTDTKLHEHRGGLWLRLGYSGDVDSKALSAVMGDGFFPSTDPNVRALDLKIYDVVVELK